MKNLSILSKGLRKREFLKDIKKVCEKHGLTMLHEDGHGSFIIEDYNDFNIRWLNNAEIDFDKTPVKKETFIENPDIKKLAEFLNEFDLRCGLIIENDIIIKNEYGGLNVDSYEAHKYNCPIAKEIYRDNVYYYISEKETYNWFKSTLKELLIDNEDIIDITTSNHTY